ncbi:MAG: hypothetical protein IT381_03015 [Deltaproteobacteria bacterium]|nr:hypothetical protein [Deltaproteobacteria bacterium]
MPDGTDEAKAEAQAHLDALAAIIRDGVAFVLDREADRLKIGRPLAFADEQSTFEPSSARGITGRVVLSRSIEEVAALARLSAAHVEGEARSSNLHNAQVRAEMDAFRAAIDRTARAEGRAEPLLRGRLRIINYQVEREGALVRVVADVHVALAPSPQQARRTDSAAVTDEASSKAAFAAPASVEARPRREARPADRVSRTTVPRMEAEVRVALGFQAATAPGSQAPVPDAPLASSTTSWSLASRSAIVWGLTDRLSWSVATLALACRLDDSDRYDLALWGGLLGWGLYFSQGGGVGATFTLGLGLDARYWLAENESVFAQAGVYSYAARSAPNDVLPTTWWATPLVGYSRTFKRIVTLNIAFSVALNFLVEARAPRPHEIRTTLAVGSVHNLGLRPQPLLQFHVLGWLSIDTYFGGAFTPEARVWAVSALQGATFAF